MSVPTYFCWARFGTEAGQSVAEIIMRKEEERIANEGTFLWGIGNSVGPSMDELARRVRTPEVLFSPIKSHAHPQDVKPMSVVAWTSAETLAGQPYLIPERSLVTSGHNPGSAKRAHYALVCFSGRPLISLESKNQVSSAKLTNLLSGRPIGASQVTSIVQYNDAASPETSWYEISFTATLIDPYIIRLRQPILLWEQDSHAGLSTAVRTVWGRLKVQGKLDGVARCSRMDFPDRSRLELPAVRA